MSLPHRRVFAAASCARLKNCGSVSSIRLYCETSVPPFKRPVPVVNLKKISAASVVSDFRLNSKMDKRVGFIGSGQMAEALARGFINKGLIQAEKMCCTDPNPARKELFKSIGITPFESNVELASNSDVIFIAVKPQNVEEVLQEIQPEVGSQRTIVSIAAGVTLERLQSAAGPEARIVRVMPNTPCLVGEVAAAMSLGPKATPEDEELVRKLFDAVGRCYVVPEKLLAAVTGLSGSGPAYVFMAIEAMADGGVRAGLPRDVSQALAAQTFLGSAKMVLETGRHPGALKDMVTSPAGTTIAGVHELERAGLRAAMMNAVMAATQRAEELAAPAKKP